MRPERGAVWDLTIRSRRGRVLRICRFCPTDLLRVTGLRAMLENFPKRVDPCPRPSVTPGQHVNVDERSDRSWQVLDDLGEPDGS
jgi:hypothetical protein